VVLPSGESTIDDCAVPNVMLPEAARQLLCGDIIKVPYARRRSNAILENVLVTSS